MFFLNFVSKIFIYFFQLGDYFDSLYFAANLDTMMDPLLGVNSKREAGGAGEGGGGEGGVLLKI